MAHQYLISKFNNINKNNKLRRTLLRVKKMHNKVINKQIYQITIVAKNSLSITITIILIKSTFKITIQTFNNKKLNKFNNNRSNKEL